MLDTFPFMADSTCAWILRFHGLTMESLNLYVLGPLSAQSRNWQGLGNYDIGELLVKMDRKIYLLVLTGT